MPIDPWTSLLIGALGAATLGLAGAAVGAIFTARREHSHWIRQQRLNAYLGFLRVMETAPSTRGDRDFSEAFESYYTELRKALSDVELLGPARVTDAAQEYRSAVALRRAEGARQSPMPAGPNDPIDTLEDFILASEREEVARAVLIRAAQRHLGIGG